MGAERVIGLLRRRQRGAVDDQRLGIGALQFDRRLHQALDRIGDIVRLVEHVGRSKALAPRSSASISSLNTRNRRNGSTDPVSRSSSPYFESLKWKPPSFPKRTRRATICSILTFGA